MMLIITSHLSNHLFWRYSMLNLHYVQPDKPSLKSWCRITIRQFFDHILYTLKENIWQNMVLYLLAFKQTIFMKKVLVLSGRQSTHCSMWTSDITTIVFGHPMNNSLTFICCTVFGSANLPLNVAHLESISANNKEVIPSSIPLLFKDNMVIRTTRFQMDSFWCNIK